MVMQDLTKQVNNGRRDNIVWIVNLCKKIEKKKK